MPDLARLALATLVVLSTMISGSSTSRAADPYAFLQGTRWYVPASTLPAVMLDPATGRTAPLVDQTVWAIDGYRDGYFTGRAVVLLKIGPKQATQCMRLIGSVTPTGSVLVSFVDVGAADASGATTGTGRLELSARRWRFLMQMATGSSSLVAHWSWMDRCSAGEPCATRLPGTTLGLAEFLALCP